MVLGDMVVDVSIFVSSNYARELVCGLVHSHLKNVLGHLQTERHRQEPVSVMMGIECGQI